MKVRCKGRCRGDGKLYALYVAENARAIEVRSSSPSGESLPSRVVALSDDEFVLVLVDFDIVQRVAFYVRGRVQEDELVLGSLFVDPKRFSLESKANGVLRKSLCDRIRNIDRSGLSILASLVVDALIPTAEGALVRGSLLNITDVAVGGVLALDKEGKVIGQTVDFLNKPLNPSEGFSGRAAHYFSISIPSNAEWFCLCATNVEGDGICFVACQHHEVRNLWQRSRIHFSSSFEDLDYSKWIASRRLTGVAAETQRNIPFSHRPLFSVVVPLYNTPLHFFREMIESVIAQTYANWELVLVNSTPDFLELKALVDAYQASDNRIKVIELEKNYGITENTNLGIAEAKGDYICFFDHDDVLEPDILFEYASAIDADGGIDLLYCDEDKLLPNGEFAMPTFKPDFSLNMVRDNNYICHMLTVRRAAFDSVEPSGPELDGAQDHAMVLKIAELGGIIHHVDKILYHWRISETSTAGNADSKPYATKAGIRAVQEHLDRLGVTAAVSNAHGRAFRYRVDYGVPVDTMASIIVATRGDVNILSDFISSIAATDFGSFELIFCVSEDKFETLSAWIDELSPAFSIHIVECDESLSLAAWRNRGAEIAAGDVLVFMHDDVRPDARDWLQVLAGFALRSEVGVVGSMLLNNDDTIQEAGVTFVGDNFVPLSAGLHRSSPGYIFLPLTVRDVAAVSGACIATSKGAFSEVGGFDERYRLDYSDVDYCFAAKKKGLQVVYTPEAPQYHLAVTNNSFLPLSVRKPVHYQDKALLLNKWSEVFADGDPFFNRNFSRRPDEASLYKLGGGSSFETA